MSNRAVLVAGTRSVAAALLIDVSIAVTVSRIRHQRRERREELTSAREQDEQDQQQDD